MPRLERQTPSDEGAIEALVERSFGPGRFALTAYRLREGNGFLPDLSFVAREGEGGEIIGSVRFVSVRVGDAGALLLGPLVVAPEKRGAGAGLALVKRGCEEAGRLGHRWAFLVGDLAYYEKAGFVRVKAGAVMMPGPFDSARLLMRDLSGKGESAAPQGMMTRNPIF